MQNFEIKILQTNMKTTLEEEENEILAEFDIDNPPTNTSNKIPVKHK